MGGAEEGVRGSSDVAVGIDGILDEREDEDVGDDGLGGARDGGGGEGVEKGRDCELVRLGIVEQGVEIGAELWPMLLAREVADDGEIN